MDNEKFDESEKAFQKAYEIKKVVIGGNHPSSGLALINIGMLNFVRKDYDRAEIPLLDAINMFNRTKALDDPFLSLAYYWLGRSYLESNRLKESEKVLRNSIKIREKAFGKDHSKTWSSAGELAICFFKQKKYKQAEELLLGALNFYNNAKYNDKKKISRYTEYTSILYEEIGNKEKAKFYQSELTNLTDETPTLR